MRRALTWMVGIWIVIAVIANAGAIARQAIGPNAIRSASEHMRHISDTIASLTLRRR